MIERDSSYHFTVISCLLALLFHRYDALLPKTCISSDILSSKECCPLASGTAEQCGGPGRGRCEDLQVQVTDVTDGFDGDKERFQWPTTFFNRTCHCFGNFEGVDCSMCKFGWTGPNCDVKRQRVRRNILQMGKDDVEKFKRYLLMAKDTVSDYMIPTTLYQDMDDGRNPQFNEINVYDQFVWYHYYVARQNLVQTTQTNTNIEKSSVFADFAHEGPAFLTWHRAYLLTWERALREVSGDDDFTIPYWDWAGESDCNVCTDEYFGGSDATDNNTLTGSFENWRTLCADFENLSERGQLCSNNVNESSLPFLTRNPGGNERPQLQKLPSKEAVYYALSVRDYDNLPRDYDYLDNNWTQSDCSFRNLLEGFADSEHRTGLHVRNGEVTQLHNSVHLYLNGTMSLVPTSANDPMFLVHHVNIDRIFEKWLRRHGATRDEFPSKSTPTGHSRYSYMVPFFPVYTNNEFFQRSENFGYTYEGIDDQGLPLDSNERELELKAVNQMEKCKPITPPDDYSFDFTLLILIAVCGAILFLLVLIIVAFCCCCKSRSGYEKV
ncbi:tyrosinase-like [Ptychodera flava]|uniref:tyrosinase-like n=1 Tax=Ptychodera flava TaxID=63121 RepID=UPI003969C40E